jgi:uncharacterized protein (DUF433 family)
MGKLVAQQYIELRLNRDGHQRAFIAGTRVRVQDVYLMAEVQRLTPDEIVRELPHLTLGQVHAALAYYFDHPDEILNEIRQDEDFVAKMRAATGAGPLAQKLNRTHDS